MSMTLRSFSWLLPLACALAASPASAHAPPVDPVVGTWLAQQPGTGTFLGYDAQGNVIAGPIAAPFTGTRVIAP